MNAFPAVDPIPLPAPVWLMKLLHIVTLSLHFVAVEMLLGGLLLAVVLSLFRGSAHSQTAARAIARRLIVVMTYVINLAVPPLLFAQVLYGRALYTSSVLIGDLLDLNHPHPDAIYRALYRFSAQLDAGKSAWAVGLAGWLLAGFVARLLSTNMTLMLRPEVWRRMYSASAVGAYLPTGDPTLEPRWLMMLAGGLLFAGLWLLYLSNRSTFTADEKKFLAGLGGKLAAGFGIVYLLAGFGQPVCSRRRSSSGSSITGSIAMRALPDTDGWRWLSWPFCWAHSPVLAESPLHGWVGAPCWWACSPKSCWLSTATACAT